MKKIKSVLQNIFEMFVSRSAANFSAIEEDYINPEDGLMYCGVCHKPKQCKVKAFGMEYTPFCACKCVQERDRRNNKK